MKTRGPLAPNQSGYTLLLALTLLGIISTLIMLEFSLGTRNQLAESQQILLTNQLQQVSQSQIRHFDQFLRAGFLQLDCSAGRIVPSKDAPAHVKARFKDGKFIFEDCDPNELKHNLREQVFNAKGVAPQPPHCKTLRTVIEQEAIGDYSERGLVLTAKTTSPRNHPLIGSGQSGKIRAHIRLPPPPVPSFGLLVNDLRCGMCHTKVTGDVVSVQSVAPFNRWHKPWFAQVDGAWYTAGLWRAEEKANGNFKIRINDGLDGKAFEQHKARPMPGRYVNGQLKVEFPKINFQKLSTYQSADKFTCSSRSIKTMAPTTSANGGLIISGSEQSPFKLTGDMHVKGDLVIYGHYQGVGTIYVDGNVYIPFDLVAKRSFLRDYLDPEDAKAEAARAVRQQSHDALAIATKRNIIIGEFDYIKNPDESVWFHRSTPAEMHGKALKIRNIYNWFPGGKAGYERLFGVAYNCVKNTRQGHRGSINLIEAYLYAENTIGGLALENSYAINGGVIANHYHLISQAMDCRSGQHPIHKRPMNFSYINYDYRMLHGLPLLDRFSAYFIKPEDAALEADAMPD